MTTSQGITSRGVPVQQSTDLPPRQSKASPEKPEVRGGHSHWLTGWMTLAPKIIKVAGLAYLARSAHGFETPTVTPTGTLMPVKSYKSDTDLVRTFVEMGGRDIYATVVTPQRFENGEFSAYHAVRYPSANCLHLDDIMQGMAEAEPGNDRLGIAFNRVSPPSGSSHSAPLVECQTWATPLPSITETLPRLPGLVTGWFEAPIKGIPTGSLKGSNVSALLLRPTGPLPSDSRWTIDKFTDDGFAICQVPSHRDSNETVIMLIPLTEQLRPGYEQMIHEGKFSQSCHPRPAPEDDLGLKIGLPVGFGVPALGVVCYLVCRKRSAPVQPQDALPTVPLAPVGLNRGPKASSYNPAEQRDNKGYPLPDQDMSESAHKSLEKLQPDEQALSPAPRPGSPDNV